MVTNRPNRIEETTPFTFFFMTAGNGKSVPVSPTVSVKATMARVYESASAFLEEREKEEPEPPQSSLQRLHRKDYRLTLVAFQRLT